MKKISVLIITLIMILSCTSCSEGNPANQEKQLLEFVNKYYGEAEVISKNPALLDTATLFTLKDKKDGFKYPITAMEVYMSDLGFQAEQGGTGKEKTIVFDGQFTMHYVANLIKNKVPHEEYTAVLDKHKEIHDVSVMTYDSSLANGVFNTEIEETACLSFSLNIEGVVEMAELMKKYDDRNYLENYIMPVYQVEEKDGKVSIKYKETSEGQSPVILGYYDFYFNYFLSEGEFDGIGMLHDYLHEKGIKNPTIKSVELGIHQHDLHIDNGFTFLPTTQEDGTRIDVIFDNKTYTFFTHLGIQEYTTEKNNYGIHKDSFLDIVATERSGGAECLIAYYASMYPESYHKLTIYLKEVTVE